MSAHFKRLAATSMLAVSFSCALHSQTTNASCKKRALPQVIYAPDPPPSHYPRADSAAAHLSVLIDEEGKVLDPKIVTSSGSEDFDHDAVVTVLKWRFKPATCDGKPFSVRIAVEINSHVMH